MKKEQKLRERAGDGGKQFVVQPNAPCSKDMRKKAKGEVAAGVLWNFDDD